MRIRRPTLDRIWSRSYHPMLMDRSRSHADHHARTLARAQAEALSGIRRSADFPDTADGVVTRRRPPRLFRPAALLAVLGMILGWMELAMPDVHDGHGDAEGGLVRKAGIMAVVLVGGDVRPGDPIHVELPPEPHRPLKPV